MRMSAFIQTLHFASLALLFLLASQCNALDASWIPATGDEPLPLSSKYRDKLRRLCKLLDTGSKMPPEIEAKRGVLEKQCFRLASDDRAGDITRRSNKRRGLFITGGVGVVGVWWLRMKHPDLIEDVDEWLSQWMPRG
mmetsp:Transcript_11891/g.18242  ORF Transcript_11891/g.18242 Transcript_11891/m.18242 type:complete len:138 (-) Transcript_11891:524-937(-)